MAGRDLSSELFGPEGGGGRDFSADLFGSSETQRKSTIGSELVRGGKQLASSIRTGAEAIFGSPEEAAMAGLGRGEEISKEAGEGVSLDAVKKAYEKEGLLSAAGEAVGQIPRALAGQVPQLAVMAGSAKLGAMAGAPLGPVGSIVGGGIGAAASLLPQFLGANVERQAAEQQAKDEQIKIDMAKAGTAAAGQAALEAAGTAFTLGKGIVKGVLGIADDAALMTAKAQQAMVKSAERSLLAAAGRGAAKGVVVEMPVEVAQSVLERAQAGLDITSPEALNEYGEAAYQAGLVGGPLGGVGGPMDTVMARQGVKAKEEFDRAQKEKPPVEPAVIEPPAAVAPVVETPVAPPLTPTEATVVPEPPQIIPPEAPAAVPVPPVESVEAPKPEAVEWKPDYTEGLPEESGTFFQNRDRSTPASVGQMQSIAANPDYTRLSVSRDLGSGAPVVISDLPIGEDQFGKTSYATASDGTRIPVRYAVVNGNDITPSNTSDGSKNPEYGDLSVTTIRPISGNGRVAGLRAAYNQGTAANYKNELLSDAEHGIDPKVIGLFQNPVLVRVMPKSYVTPNIADISNISGTLRLSPVEAAKNDINRIDLSGLSFNEDGTPNTNTLIGFVRGMPKDEQGELIDAKGMPNTKAIDRLNNAIFYKAYGSDTLIELYAQAADPEAKAVLNALAKAAPKMASLDGAGDYDVRQSVLDAAEMAVNARRAGQKLSDYVKQGSLGADPYAFKVLEMFAGNSRSSKRMAEALDRLATLAGEQASASDTDMFGNVPKMPKDDVYKALAIAPEAEPDLFTPPAEPKAPVYEETDKPEFNIDKPLEQIAKEIHGKTIPELAQWTVDNAPNEAAKAIAERVLARIKEFAAKGIYPDKVKVMNNKSRWSSGTRARVQTTSAKGYGIIMTMQFNGLQDGKADNLSGTRYSTVLHELIHAATLAQIRHTPQSKASNDLNVLYKKVKDQIDKDVKSGIASYVTDKVKLGANIIKDPAELMAWGLTDNQFQKYLSNIKIGETTGFRKLVDIVRQVLGLSKQYESALDSLVKITDEMIETPMAQVEAEMGKSGMPLKPIKVKGRRIISPEAEQDGAPEDRKGKRIKSKDLSRLLTEEQEAKTGPSTANFKKWFGDSKVVDAEGKPLVMYHGTSQSQDGEAFTYFDTYGSNYGLMGTGAYFTDNPEIASSYTKKGRGSSPTVYPVYLSIKNPIDMDARADRSLWEKSFSDVDFDEYRPEGIKNEDYFRAVEEHLTDQEIPMYEGAEVIQDGLRSMGYDGITHVGGNRFKAPNGAISDTRHRVFIAFDPIQIKSATGNKGTYDLVKTDITEQRDSITGKPILSQWTTPTDTKLAGEIGKDDLIYSLQNKMIDTKRVVDAITATAGKIVAKWNPYLQEELYHGRTAKQTKEFLTNELRPLMQDLQKADVSIAQLEEYLKNRHAIAYNAQVAKVNPSMPDKGSGIATADAQAYLNALSPADKAKFDALAKKVDAITKGTRKLLVDSGLETQETIDNWENTFPFYVPLKRGDIDYAYTAGGMGTGQGFDVRGDFSRRAMGSERDVVDVLANIAMMRERAIVKAQKNRVAQALFGLAAKNPNPEFWLPIDPLAEIDPANMQELLNFGLSQADLDFIAKEPRQKAIDKNKNEVVERINATLRNNENVLSMRFNGENRYVFFNPNDPRAQRMAKSLKNLDADQLGHVLGTISKITRWMASVNTQYNPIFGAYNFLRDVQGALLQLSTTPLAKDGKAVRAGTLPALKGIYAAVRAERSGQAATGAWSQLWEEFQQEGGQTGFRDMFSRSQERAEALQAELNKITEGKAKAAGRAMLDWLSDYNDSMENAVRLSAYKVAKEKFINQGMSVEDAKQEAASVAKNLTVNFNRKGQIGVQAGALYAFFNAAVQGTARLVETLRGPARKKIIAGGLLLGSMQAALLAAAGFDDEEPPEFVRERNLIIPLGGDKYFAFPMPLGYHVIPSTSRILTEWALSGFKDTPDRIASLTGLYLEAFNPIGNAGWSAQTLAPTFADPIVALTENKDWTGKPIARKDFSNLDPTPGYTRAKDTASLFSTQIAKFLNYATGGTEFKPGVLSPTPDQIDFLVGQATGGIGREALKVEQTVSKTISGEELPPYKIPLVGRFYGETKSSAAESGRFYKNMTMLNEHENEIKGRREKRQPIGEYLADNPEARLAPMARKTYADIQKLRKRKESLLEKDAPKESVQAVEKMITRKMQTLNERVAALQ